MRTVVLGEQPAPLRAWLERRRALGLDRFDEMWEGKCHVALRRAAATATSTASLAALLRQRARAGLWAASR